MDVDHLRFDLISPIGHRRLAARYAMGAERYGDHNYLRGIPFSNIINHLEAHLNKFKMGDTTDDNLAAIAWGAFTLMTFEELRPDLDDRYRFQKADVDDIADRTQAEALEPDEGEEPTDVSAPVRPMDIDPRGAFARRVNQAIREQLRDPVFAARVRDASLKLVKDHQP